MEEREGKEKACTQNGQFLQLPFSCMHYRVIKPYKVKMTLCPPSQILNNKEKEAE